VTLGVYFGWHIHPYPELLALVRHAEALGYAAAFVDGDVSMLETRPEADCLDGWTVTAALLASTSRISIGSMRVVHHWNAARLAQAAVSAARIAPGRFRFLISIGDWATDTRFGFPKLSAGERIAWLDETLDALRALWRGETVSCAGRFVQLDGARVRPIPPGGRIPVAVAARRPRLLELEARHADVWDINLPPIPARVAAAAERLAAACARRGRDPDAIGRSMLVFARPGAAPEAVLAEFRRWNPWFRAIPDAELRPALVQGEPAACRRRLIELAQELRLELPVVDASGLAAGAARSLLDALAPG
jgi:alkanesulfonate monooxygenase SsuD/methylene tetrahydromethanopterin reductase-like flavin-dependent oxidoreductase (luciferase family)